MRQNVLLFLLLAMALLWLSGCQKDEQRTSEVQPPAATSKVRGFYLLNQGAWGTNKASLDYYDAVAGIYIRDVYATNNPEQVKALGDVGNDLQVYGSKLYAVLNGSNKVEVIDLATTRSLGKVDIASPRNIRFAGGRGYVTSYVAAGGATGEVVAIDTATFTPQWRVPVGREPEELAVIDARLYVANSGGFKKPDYERTLSVIPIAEQRVAATIDVGINLELVRGDAHGQLWVTARGNYAEVSSSLYCLTKNPSTGQYEVAKDMRLPCTRFDIRGDSLVYYSTVYDAAGNSSSRFGVINVRTREALSGQWITDGTETEIRTPYNVFFQPQGGNIYVLDAKDFKSSGEVFAYSYDGRRLWHYTTGDIPACIAFVGK